MAALRARYLQHGGSENVVLSTVQLLTGTLFVVALFVIGSVRLALVMLAEQSTSNPINVDSVRAMVALGSAMAEIVGLRSVAVFVAVSSTRAVRSGLFPRWWWVVSLVMALALLLAFRAWPLASTLLPAWVVGTSLFVMSARRSAEAGG
jgi:cytochrome bd-type quinol oxidase subunit 2